MVVSAYIRIYFYPIHLIQWCRSQESWRTPPHQRQTSAFRSPWYPPNWEKSFNISYLPRSAGHVKKLVSRYALGSPFLICLLLNTRAANTTKYWNLSVALNASRSSPLIIISTVSGRFLHFDSRHLSFAPIFLQILGYRVSRKQATLEDGLNVIEGKSSGLCSLKNHCCTNPMP